MGNQLTGQIQTFEDKLKAYFKLDFQIQTKELVTIYIKKELMELTKFEFVNKLPKEIFSKAFEENYQHTVCLIHCCIDIIHEFAYKIKFEEKVGGKSSKKEGTQETICSGAIYLLIRLVGFLAQDSQLMKNVMWEEESQHIESGRTIPYAIKLVESILVLLFKPGYTIRYPDPQLQLDEQNLTQQEKDQSKIWAFGLSTIRSTNNKVNDFVYYKTRNFLLKLLLTTLSQQLYCNQEEYQTKLNPYLDLLTNKYCVNIKVLTFSLFNTVFGYDCDGYKIPYASSIQLNKYIDPVLSNSLQILNILIDYNPNTQEIQKEMEEDPLSAFEKIRLYYEIYEKQEMGEDIREEEKSAEAKRESKNQVYKFIHQINGHNNAVIVAEGLQRLFRNYIRINKTWLTQQSYYQIPFHKELFILLWQISYINPQFANLIFNQIGDQKEKEMVILMIIKFILVRIDQAKENEKNTLNLYLYFLLLLSHQSEEFRSHLSNDFDFRITLSTTLLVGGVSEHTKYGDRIVIYLQEMIKNPDNGFFNKEYHRMTAIISNISPHLKKISQIAATALFDLFHFFLDTFNVKEKSHIDADQRERNLFSFINILQSIKYILCFQSDNCTELKLLFYKKQEEIRGLMQKLNLKVHQQSNFFSKFEMGEEEQSNQNQQYTQYLERSPYEAQEKENLAEGQAIQQEEQQKLEGQEEQQQEPIEDQEELQEKVQEKEKQQNIVEQLEEVKLGEEKKQYESPKHEDDHLYFSQLKQVVYELGVLLREVDRIVKLQEQEIQNAAANAPPQPKSIMGKMIVGVKKASKVFSNQTDKQLRDIVAKIDLKSILFQERLPEIEMIELQLYPNFDNWLSSLIWERVIANHVVNSTVFDEEKIKILDMRLLNQ